MKELFVRQVIFPQLIENMGFKSESATTASAVSTRDQKEVAGEQMDTDDISSVAGSVAQETD